VRYLDLVAANDKLYRFPTGSLPGTTIGGVNKQMGLV
jgi:hypothetical protein